MPPRPAVLTKRTLDKDLDKITYVEDAAKHVARRLVAPGLGLIFVGLAMLFAGVYVFDRPGAVLIVAAAALAGYMALNIGANDVTNNVGAAVGARAMTMGQALVIAAVFEVLGATIGGGEVVKTISSDIVDAGHVSPAVLGWIMMAALTAAALWINLATWMNAPVSTTHAIVGAVIGAGISAVGPEPVNWRVMFEITSSWITSPLLGGLIAAGLLYLVKTLIIYRDDKIAAARRWVPVLVAVMAGGFMAYMVLQMSPVGRFPPLTVVLIGIGIGLVSWLAVRPLVLVQARDLENRNSSLRVLFRLPLIGSAALLSFAHGANDVSNAVGPLSAVVHSVGIGGDGGVGHPPLWVMLIGAFGISVGLLLFGPRLIRLVGEEITKLNPMRAYCVALSTAFTVIVASWLGLPVSTTHVAVGAVFGVGFFREWYTRHSKRRIAYLRRKAESWELDEPEEPNIYERRRRYLVRRSHLMTIVAAWIITVPVSGALAAMIYWVMFALFV
ncbi:inorganic phosphate transporter [Rhizobium bangladeshense]|uniref:inorganic phosphate transporter n=1 Tax=Rhizobium bangladeshense TaxID=1138189 RepID=UPI001A9A2550|nr:inorganic phosphate transporter [Rhizobium bangladeshense]MBX4865578.1 inorganic phosphate transporter [Rhizobium bangladeshense]MBX4896342.1 inorganic phosphate transporter [Rhizobium bangladeshense]MBX4902199.1 inorganic phosphate transporter [Rhizobium bangladeshense]MBY3596208.1 inorganic phosphate transporter [Rhizobium bangladeshense]MBY3613790.1 inorganic phosphate transporter [Rhizobium bangladeshense]